MSVKQFVWFFLIVIIIWSFGIVSSIYAKDSSLQSHLLGHVGKSYTGVHDPSYLDYDLALREYMVDRIGRKFGIGLDPKIYSGFDLLEIEALFRCRKSEEPFDIFLKMFPKHP